MRDRQWRRLGALVLGFAAFVAGPGPAEAQDSVPVPAIELAGQVELARLVDLAVQRLGLTVQYDPAVLRGTVTLRLGAALSDEELWQLTNRVLASQGLTTVRVPGGNAYSVVRLTDAPTLAQLQDGPAPPGPAAGFQTLVYRPAHRSPMDLLEAVRPLMSKTGSSAAELPGTGMLLLADLLPRLEEVQRLLAVLDVPTAAPVVEEIRVRNMGAAALVSLAKQVADKRDLISGRKLAGELIPLPGSVLLVAPEETAVTWRALLEQLDQREPVATSTYTPRAFAPQEVARLIESVLTPAAGAQAAAGDERWRLVVDELTGSLIITATAAQHEEIRALLERIDVSAPEARRPMRSFVIRNRSVLEMLALLREMLGTGLLETASADGDGGDGTDPGAPALSAPDIGRTDRPVDPRGGPPVSVTSQPRPRSSPLLQGLGRRGSERVVDPSADVVLTADEATSTIIAVADARTLAQIERLIRQLDVRQPQVMLEVLMVSLSESQSLALGVELQQELDLGGETRGTLASLFGLAQRGADGIPGVGSGAGFTGLVLNPGDFSVVIRALQTVNDGRSMSLPHMLVGNNQQANFSSVLQQPFATVNTGTATSTTSFGGTLDAGTIASVRPQIAAGDHLILDYSVQLSSFVGASAGEGLPPPKQTNSVASSVTIPDGHTVVVGGLELLADAGAESRVPGIGGIPVIGELFKNRTKNHSRDRFFVFIRANVMRHGGFEDLKYLSSRDRAAAGVEDGWPEVEPRMIR